MRTVVSGAVCLAILAAGALLGARAWALGVRGLGLSHKVALTFDDLPVHAALPSGMRRSDIVRQILATVRGHRVPPVYGFVNGNGVGDDPDNAQALRLWRAGGQLLGNHTFSHMDLHTTTLAAFEVDVAANEPTLRTHMGSEDWHWLRFPYLHEGETIEKRRGAAGILSQRGYRVAEVSLNFDDWAFSDPYVRCLGRNEAASVTWIQDQYLRRAAESLSRDTRRTATIFGRDIAHVMLLHAGALSAVMLPRLIGLLEGQGFSFVTLEEALRDAAYAEQVRPLPAGGTWLDHVMAMRGTAPPPTADDTLARLEAMCR